MIAGAPILSVAAMRAAEEAVFEKGVDPFALMQRAGQAAAEIIWRAGGKRDTLILCGPGNNGGDGYVVARTLADRGVPVRVATISEPRTDSAQKAAALWGGPIEDVMEAASASQIVDALFGIGLTRGLDDVLAHRFAALAEVAERTIAIDVPSGVDSDTGALLSLVPRIDLCLALGALKPAHVLGAAASLCRQTICLDIGLDPGDQPLRVLQKPRLSQPAWDAHKYRRGLVAVVPGAMPGAAALAAEAAARSGAGYVRLMAPAGNHVLPAALVVDEHAEAVADPRIAALLIGMGLGRSADAAMLLRHSLSHGHPAVVDADALHLLHQEGLVIIPSGSVLTPHGGEFDALFGVGDGSKIDRTLAAAKASHAVVVHKGADTVIAAPDGRVRVAKGSSPWLSTAGTGDVLAGIIAGRLAATRDPFMAACEGVWLHGEAARIAGPAFVADDLLNHISDAVGACL